METQEGVALAADVGGTNTTLALIHVKDLSIIYKEHEWTKNIHSFSAHVQQFLERARKKNVAPTRACVAAAGPVTKHGDDPIYHEIALSHANLVISEENLLQETLLKEVHLLNDIEASGYATFALKKEDYKTLRKGKEQQRNRKDATRVVVNFGTGVSTAQILYEEKQQQYFIKSLETGHTDFPCIDQEELQLITFIKHQNRIKGNITYEHVLSTQGIETIYEFHAQKPLPITQIMHAKDAHSIITKKTVAKFMGRYCRNSLVNDFAQGGLYIAGGVAQKNPDLFSRTFFDELERQSDESFKELAENTQVILITSQDINVQGAAQALRMK